MTQISKFALSLIAGGLFSAGAAQAATLGSNVVAYALGDEGRTLVKVADAMGGPATGVALDFGTNSSMSLDTIAYRPQTGQLYGYDDEADTVYEINTATGATTAVVTNANVTTNDDAGFDFNNVLDAARLVTAEGENVVFFPNNTPPTLEPKTDLFFVAGDENEGVNPNVVMNAYTNAVPDASSTMQFVLDSDWNILATLGNNAGTLSTVGDLYLNGTAFDITEDGGFDILSMTEGDNTAYALLTMGGMQSLYEVPLFADGMGQVNLTYISDVTSDFGTLDGLAVFTDVAPVPIPASVTLLGTALLGMGAARRLRKGKTKA